MRFAIAMCVLCLCLADVSAGPIRDKLRARGNSNVCVPVPPVKLQPVPTYVWPQARPSGCHGGACVPNYAPAITAATPALSACPGGVCPLPRR
jgi:hypothetical protein